jgi:hypothetical protein
LIPDISELQQFSDAELSSIPGFTVMKFDEKDRIVASITWKEPVDLRNLDLDCIINIDDKGNVEVYGNDNKPPEGSELNKEAEVSIFGVSLKKGQTAADKEKLLKSTLENVCADSENCKMEHKMYDPNWSVGDSSKHGKWSFTVYRFI